MNGNLLFVFAAPVLAANFSFEKLESGRLAVLDGGKTVLVYNYGPQLAPGAPDDRKRCCYVHPVNTPSGVTVTDDFPKDHYHHHGLFWAWPIVEVGGERYDLWVYKGVEHRFGGFEGRSAEGESALLRLKQTWVVGSRTIANEDVAVKVHAAKGADRTIQFSIRITPLEALSIGGAPEQQKGYGGFSVRFAPRTETAIDTDRGRLSGDENHVTHPWASLSASYQGKRARLRIDSDKDNPGFPTEWCLRQYGFLGSNYPGARLEKLEAGKPINLRYTVTVSDLP
ncbi:MAG: PmoA family protein [Bryobacterales bacterium]|nr:PmoA family protein [Bryobacterales bacterium]